MKPERFPCSTGDTAIRERVVDRGGLIIAHVVLPAGEFVPRHPADVDVFLLVVRGILTLPGEGGPSAYGRDAILHLPKGSPMEPRNEGNETLEFFVVKTPAHS